MTALPTLSNFLQEAPIETLQLGVTGLQHIKRRIAGRWCQCMYARVGGERVVLSALTPEQEATCDVCLTAAILLLEDDERTAAVANAAYLILTNYLIATGRASSIIAFNDLAARSEEDVQYLLDDVIANTNKAIERRQNAQALDPERNDTPDVSEADSQAAGG